MIFNPDNWAHETNIIIDKDKIDQDLINFPVSIVLASGTGINNYDISDVFTQLTSESGIDQYTKLILSCTGDRSNYKNIINVVGNPQIISTTFSGFTSCIYFDGAGDRINIQASSLWDFNTEDFTVDWWEYRITSSISEATCSTDYAGGFRGLLAGHDDGAGNLNVYMSSNGTSWDIATAKSLGAKSMNQWVHLAVVRSGNDFYAYKDGVQQSTWTSSSSLYYNYTNFCIGANQSPYDFDGYVSGFRIIKGEALWTSDFSSNLPTWPYTTNSGTKLLLGFDGDTSASGNTINFNGTIRMDSSAGYFDGSYKLGGTDYLIVPYNEGFSFGSGDFTLEAYVYMTANSSLRTIMSRWRSSDGTASWYMSRSTTGKLRILLSSTGSSTSYDLSTTATLSLNEWHHVAIIRHGDVIYGAIDGIVEKLEDLSSGFTLHSNTRDVYIGRMSETTSYNYVGHMSNIRISKGIARWVSDFVPPKTSYDIPYSWHNRKKIAITTTVTGVETELYTEIEDWSEGYFSVYPRTFSTSTVKATSTFDTSYYPHFATDPNLNLTGSITNNSWVAGSGQHSNQKFNVDLGDAKVIKRILLHNICHLGSTYYNNGIFNFSIYGTNSSTAFNDTTYTGITDLTQLGTFQARQHIAEDVEDRQYFYLDNDIAYRYHVLRIEDDFGGPEVSFGIRHIEFQEYIKEAILWAKVPTISSETNTELTLYYDKAQIDNNYVDADIKLLIQDSFNDNSIFNKTITKAGDTTSLKFNTHNNPLINYSAFFNGSNAYLTVPNSVISTSTSTFTIDAWLFLMSSVIVADYSPMIGDAQPAGSTNYWSFGPDDEDKLAFQWWDGSNHTAQSTNTISLNKWTHIAVSVNNNNIKLFINGTEETISGTSTLTNRSSTLNSLPIGVYNSNYFDAYIASIRITDTYEYSSNFTSPRSYISDTNTKLLIDFTESGWGQGNTPATFTESGNVGYTVTNSSSNVIGCTFWWPQALTFDGTGDYLSIASSSDFNFGTNDFTKDIWVYPKQTGKTQRLFCRHNTSTGWLLTIKSSNDISYTNGSISLLSTSTIDIGMWMHIAVVRDGNNWDLYINGVSEDSTSSSDSSVDNDIALQIGRVATQTSYDLNGYLAEARIIKNQALWVTNFVPPKQPADIGYVGDIGSAQARNVWDYDFEAVYHMNQDPSIGTDSILDSTSNKYNGTPQGSMTPFDLVHISNSTGKALEFDGIDDYIYNNNLLYPITLTLYSKINIYSIGTTQTILHQGDTDVGSNQGTRLNINASGYLYITYYNGSWRTVTSTIALSTGIHNISVIINSDTLKCIFTVDDVQETKDIPIALTTSTYPFKIGASKTASISDLFDGVIDEVRVIGTYFPAAWAKATNYSNFNQLIYFDTFPAAIFYFSNPTPTHLATVYGTTKQLYLTVTVTGSYSSYIYDAIFYDDLNNQIGSTISGANSGQSVSVPMNTPDGASYYWYVSATSSGVSDMSETYQFTNKFLCEGYVEEQDVRTSGIPVRLHRRSNGEVIGNDVSSTVSGIFAIETDYNEEHYVVALHTDPTYNALIYDRITP